MQNFMKTILSAVQTWTKGKIKDSAADWDQNDSSADSYVKNRTHWEEEDGTVHKLDSKYLNLPTNLATTDDVESAKQEAVDVANTAQSTADTAQTTADGKMDKNNPVGTGSFSMNGKANGSNSSAFGLETVALGRAQSVGGEYNIADKAYQESVEIGSATAETVPAGLSALNSESKYYIASDYMFDKKTGKYTLVDPVLTAGTSRLEGKFMIRGGGGTADKMFYLKDYFNSLSMTSGGYDYRYRRDIYTSVYSENDRAVYAHIVGNGTSDDARSNAHTLDWNGVGWYQGGLQVGGNAQDDGAKNVLLEGDAIPVPESATVGQTIVVKSIDENGKPTEWEVVDPFALTDENTDAKYKLSIVDGKLTMTEVTA